QAPRKIPQRYRSNPVSIARSLEEAYRRHRRRRVMGSRRKTRGKKLDEFFARALKASPRALDTSEQRVLSRLRSEAAKMTTEVRFRDAVEETKLHPMSW